MNSVEFEFCDFVNPVHTETYTDLLNAYMSDPMGDYPVHDNTRKQKLIESLAAHPTVFVLFILCKGEYVGFSTCFINFSTFKIKPYLYVHDVFVRPGFRGVRLGRRLMEELISIAQKRDCCKVSLEVREDNPSARSLYQSLGFRECEPRMLYWEKTL